MPASLYLTLFLGFATVPKPNVTRLKSVMGHSVFGLGMYATGRLLAP